MMNKTVLNYGLIGGLICTVLFLGPVLLFPDGYMKPENYTMWEIVGYSTMVLSMLPIYFGTRAYRNKITSGTFSFMHAFKIAMLITVVATVIFYLGNVLVYEVLAPGFLQEFASSYKENILKMEMSEAERADILKQMESSEAFINNPYLNALLMAGSVFFIGLIISLLSGLILRTKK